MNTLVLASWLRQFVFWISLVVATIGLIGFSNAETPQDTQKNPLKNATRNPPAKSQWIYIGKDPQRGIFYFDAAHAAAVQETAQVRYLLGIMTDKPGDFTLLTNEEDCKINHSRWGFTEQSWRDGKTVSDITRPEDKVPYFLPRRDSIEEAANHKVCYCTRYPDSIVCRPENLRMKEIYTWANPGR